MEKMTDEDEVDILNDISFENYLSKTESDIYGTTSLVSQNSDFLNCDYTIHPQWLLDRPSANPDCWYGTDDTEIPEEPSNTSEKDEGLPQVTTTQNSITDDSGWTDNEKNLLQRGIEIFDKNVENLSQFIGSKTPIEVKYYLQHFYVEFNKLYSTVPELNADAVRNEASEILTDIEIPTSIEEVIDNITTAGPTVPSIRNKKKRFQYLTGNNTVIKLKTNKQSQKTSTVTTQKTGLKVSVQKYAASSLKDRKLIESSVKHSRFKLNLEMPRRADKKTFALNKSAHAEGTHKKRKPESTSAELTTGRGLSVPVCDGEEIVKITKENSEEENSDVDIEVDVDDIGESSIIKSDSRIKQFRQSENTLLESENDISSSKEVLQSSAISLLPDIHIDSLSEMTIKQLMNMEEPKEELVLNDRDVTELEKVIHCDFFDVPVKKSSKTPERYLKIRNFIINTWKSSKPTYVTKTSLRQGLRNCGDVNCIGRIHSFLEQIGVINFGCPQVSYIRPLYNILKSSSKEKVPQKSKPNDQTAYVPGSRQRYKKKFTNDGEGGCTLTHDEQGTVIHTTIVCEKPIIRKSYTRKPAIHLITCRAFTKEMPQRFTVALNIAALLPMNFHAHTSMTEVMGLVAGYWDPSDKTLIILGYEPCRNIASSSTHCEMCPVSQAKAAESIRNQGWDVVGWFHSHPTFAPEPSQQDLETQLSLQQSLGSIKPCVGVILSPFNDISGCSQCRCLIVDKKRNFDDQMVPYKLHVDLRSDGFSVDTYLNEIWKIYHSDAVSSDIERLEFNKAVFKNSSVTLLEKYLSDLKIHLSKCSDLNKKTFDAIINGISDMFKT